MSYEAVRKDYAKHTLEESDCLSDPIDMLDHWLKEALIEMEDANAMTLTTVSPEGYPESRVVLIRQLDQEGLVFYTNYESAKGKDIASNPKVGVNFFWPWLERQVRVRGTAERISAEASDAYFKSRPRESQLGAWASIQSAKMTARNQLDKQLLECTERFKDQDVPRPPHWGGFRIKPQYFEFWQGRTSRLHDRIKYESVDGGWKLSRLFP
ncbi:MAG: pyridoxamine 5'-phosphate oxidase [Flavobacteriales bacterium]|nr:pyridoxamine 5'-phosphate oxidase [Flavobacteriales bacterium]